jgi:GNAT superfamily N-acetyltransferase
MASMTIRRLDEERDPEPIVALLRDAQPNNVVSPGSWLHRVRTVPERARHACWVADDGGEVVGYAFGFLDFFGSGRAMFCNTTVRVDRRRRRIGSALYARVRTHAVELGAASAIASFVENAAGVAFAKAHGFVEVRAETDSMLDPATVDRLPPAEVDLRTVADVDPHLVYAVDMAATRDLPSTEPIVDDMPYDEWAAHVLEHPLFTADGSFVAVVDGVAAAVSLLIVDEESSRAAHMFTGTLREYRGRGLGMAVKLASIAWARERGISRLVTSNDERNAPMLAINRKLGYVPSGRRVEYSVERERLLREAGEYL